MKKITAGFDGLSYSKSTRDYAISLAKDSGALVLGVFLDDELHTSYKVYDLIKQGISVDKLETFAAKDSALRDEAAANFGQACTAAGIPHAIHRDRNDALQELKHESVYSDLLVIKSSEALSHEIQKPPARFIRELISDLHSPILLVPMEYVPITRVVLLFDAEPPSVNAMKMFSYLLPQYNNYDTEIVSVNPSDSSFALVDHSYMKEFVDLHFPNARYKILHGSAEKEIIHHLEKKDKGTLVVLGANRRNAVGKFFHESMADVLLKNVSLPIFVVH